MTNGIDGSSAVAVFITPEYIQKCKKEGNDNCKLEFEYAYQRKTVKNLIPVVMEPDCASPASWEGRVGAVLGTQLYIDCAGDSDEDYKKALDEIEARFQILLTGSQPIKEVKAKRRFRDSAVGVSSAVMLEGCTWLLKHSSGTRMRRWQRRYFAVAGHYLKYADNEEKVQAAPKATVDLQALQMCTLERGQFLSLYFNDSLVLELQAATLDEAEAWHDMLQSFIHDEHIDDYAPRKGTLIFERSHQVRDEKSDMKMKKNEEREKKKALLSESESKKAVLSVTFVGASGVGKTCMMSQTNKLLMQLKQPSWLTSSHQQEKLCV
jgi:hypothetical protein